ncbi:HAD family hydrolase [Pelagibaculum spongiae]|uniref:Phosphoglycolate phosphatase n=1 Tax=Pelagibaculum spongiae TaxID=2080658 RepID=A0A2V1H331_9GAMM|nr:HAD-IA family hydrolase [Pelagibaculum spongiae]PVZ71628.1 phosphoglycolate phosphatase [Pelagibaculum spongiae]
MTQSIKGVLFDLDGTLLDTAPDLAGALNLLLQENGRPALPFDIIRPAASHGSAALIKTGFNIEPDDSNFPPLQKRYLELYLQNIATSSQWFDGISELIDYLTDHNIRWGIVTNKPEFLTLPLLKGMAEKSPLASQPACIVCGDTAAKPKPDPAPMHLALSKIAVAATDCLYIGDAERDIQAGKVVNCPTVLASWGYISDNDQPALWQADFDFTSPTELLHWLSN